MNNLNLMFFMMVGWLELHMVAGVVIAALIVALFAALIVSGRGLFSGKAFMGGLGIAVVVWLIFIAILPALTDSSLAQVSYSTDYIMLALMSAGFGGIAFLLAYPLLALMRKKA